MYHSVIGKKLVESLNKRDGKDRTVQEFFVKEYVPLFFGSSRLLQNVNNSPYDQKFTKKKKPYSDALRDACTLALHNKVKTKKPDASFYLGGPAAGREQTTSGQVTCLEVPTAEEDVYASWIGDALGLTVEGGITLLIDSEDVLIETYNGWAEYRRYLDQTPAVKSMQINTWNCQRLASVLLGEQQPFVGVTDKKGEQLVTQKWVRLLFALSFQKTNRQARRMLAYCYKLGRTNTTIGFVQLDLQASRYIADLYERLFTVPGGFSPARFANLYETAESFQTACKYSDLGLAALRPEDMFNARKGVPKLPSAVDGEKRASFYIYQTWIIAMLNKEELLSLAKELAVALAGYQHSGKRGTNVELQSVKNLLGQRTRRDFIESLTDILSSDPGNSELYEHIVTEILALRNDLVPLFLTLLRFEFALSDSKSKE